jgi:hypothetical protein
MMRKYKNNNKTERFVFYVRIVTKEYSWNDRLNVNYGIAAISYIYIFITVVLPVRLLALLM